MMENDNGPVSETSLSGIPLLLRGKVRDVYDLGDFLLIVATDRISAFDFVLPTPIPDKGRILTRLSVFWFDYLKDMVSNHIVETDVEKFGGFVKDAAYAKTIADNRKMLKDRSMLVKKARSVKIECVVRGYLAGSGWEEYGRQGTVCGIRLPEGLAESEKLEEPIFTPATKSKMGMHDINITEEQMIDNIGGETGKILKETSLELYVKASRFAFERGIIIADTKFEFGICEGKIILIDEILTPDSSRFWDEKKYAPGKPQDSYDKQFVRDYLTSIGWNRQPPAPNLPADVVEKTRQKYLEAERRITGI